MTGMLGYRPILRQSQTYFDDVVQGQEVPEHQVSFNVIKMAWFAAVSGDFYPSHYDNIWAREKSHHPAATVHGLHVTTHLSQMITNWISPNGRLVRFSNQVRSQTFDGETLTMRGRVTGKYSESAKNFIECEIWAEKPDGSVVSTGWIRFTLPVKPEVEA